MGKVYTTTLTSCPSSPSYNVTFTYDAFDQQAEQYGKGYRTGMQDGSGSTAWKYDTRGRLWQELKHVNGAGDFQTQWSYNSSDGLAWMKYPGNNQGQEGEKVTYEYNAQNALDSVSGTSTYVQSTTYDAAGRTTLRILGSNTVRTQYLYNSWDYQGGACSSSKQGYPAIPPPCRT